MSQDIEIIFGERWRPMSSETIPYGTVTLIIGSNHFVFWSSLRDKYFLQRFLDILNKKDKTLYEYTIVSYHDYDTLSISHSEINVVQMDRISSTWHEVKTIIVLNDELKEHLIFAIEEKIKEFEKRDRFLKQREIEYNRITNRIKRLFNY